MEQRNGANDATNAWGTYTGALEKMYAAQGIAANKSGLQLRLSMEAQDKAASELSAAFSAVVGGLNLLDTSFEDIGTKTFFVTDRTQEQTKSFEELRAEYERTEDNIRSLTSGTGGLGLTTEELSEKLTKEYEQLDRVRAAMEPLEAVGGRIVETYKGFSVNMEAVNDYLYQQAAAAGVDADMLVALGVATGQFSEEQGIAALRAAALKQKIDEIATALADGTIPTIQAARSELSLFIARMDAVPPLIETEFIIRVQGLSDLERAKDLMGQVGGGAGTGVTLGAAGALAPELITTPTP
jgi:chromosome segregation ATPase